MDALAVGVPVLTGPAAGWNFWPVLGIPLAWLLAFAWLRIPLRTGTAIAVSLVGVLSADAIATWGVVPVASTAALGVVTASTVLRFRRRFHPPNV